jgi:ABC-type nitrate/sulfonate/bicarbonate transport system substrate-binding protein
LFAGENRIIRPIDEEELEMSLARLNVMYGHLEGTDGKFARDITGYLSIDAGIYERYGLEVSWNHVQGTEERYRRLESGQAQISFVVGRASLQHFLDTRATRLLGCAMNSCPYLLIADAAIGEIKDLRGKAVACREGPARGVSFDQLFQQVGGLKIDGDVKLQFLAADQDAFKALLDGEAQAALLPRPYGFIAEERGFHRLEKWPGAVDDPLPISIETTDVLWREREKDFSSFITAHREGVRHARAHPGKVIELLTVKFGHSRALAEKTFDDYMGYMDESLLVEMRHLTKLLGQVAPNVPGGASKIAAEWMVPGAMKS